MPSKRRAKRVAGHVTDKLSANDKQNTEHSRNSKHGKSGFYCAELIVRSCRATQPTGAWAPCNKGVVEAPEARARAACAPNEKRTEEKSVPHPRDPVYAVDGEEEGCCLGRNAPIVSNCTE